MLKRYTYGVLRGGLGNQLFQISAYSALAKRGGRKLVLDLNSYRHPSQIALSRIPSALALDLVPVERAFSFRNPVFSRFIVAIHWAMRLTFDSIPGLQGKFGIVASEKAGRRLEGIQGNKSFTYLDSYFGDLYKDEDLDEAISRVTDSLAHLSKKLLPETLFPEKPWSALHIRMGDYLTVDPAKIISLSTIEDGLRAIKWNAGEKLLLFSDSPERAREVLAPLCIGENLEFADPSLSEIETLLFMGAANRLVCSRSTFSWWAARLVTRAGGEVAFPKPSRGDAFTLRECPGWSWI